MLRLSKEIFAGAMIPFADDPRKVYDTKGNRIPPLAGNVELTIVEGPSLVVRSGELTACDPYLVHMDLSPLSLAVPVGSHPTCFGVVDAGRYGRRVAFSAVRFSNTVVDHWEKACWRGQRLSSLGAGEVFWFGVDHGCACFIDLQTAMQIDPDVENNGDLYERVNDASGEASNFGAVQVGSDPNANMVVCASGLGDGAYSCFWGFASEGRKEPPVCLLANFNLCEFPDLVKAVNRPRPWWRRFGL